MAGRRVLAGRGLDAVAEDRLGCPAPLRGPAAAVPVDAFAAWPRPSRVEVRQRQRPGRAGPPGRRARRRRPRRYGRACRRPRRRSGRRPRRRRCRRNRGRGGSRALIAPTLRQPAPPAEQARRRACDGENVRDGADSIRAAAPRGANLPPSHASEPGRAAMDGVTVITHPLVQHKLTLMRDKETSTARLPPAAARDRAADVLRGDARPAAHHQAHRDADRSRWMRRSSKARSWSSPRSCAPATACSKACSISSPPPASPISASIAIP